MNKLTLESYNDRSFLIKGDTQPYKDVLKENGGSWNSSLKGWIYSNKKLEQMKDVVERINGGSFNTNILPSGELKKAVLPVSSKIKTIIWNIYCPDHKETGYIEIDKNKLPVMVSNVIIENGNPKYLYLDYNVGVKTTFKAFIADGKWQIIGEIREHDIIFQ